MLTLSNSDAAIRIASAGRKALRFEVRDDIEWLLPSLVGHELLDGEDAMASY
jgi:hypothetical protein